MHKAILNTLGGALVIAVLAVAYYLCYALQQIGSAAASVPNAAIAIQQDVSAVTDTLDRPCGSGHPCGTLAEVSKGVVKIGDAIVTTQLAERKATPHVIAAMDKFGDAADHLSGTADALTQTAHSASDTLSEGKRTIAALQPLEASLTRTSDASSATIQTFNGRLSDPRIDSLLVHIDNTAGHIDGTSADVQKVADKATGDYLAPKPWWQKIGPYANDVVRAGCLLTGRCP